VLDFALLRLRRCAPASIGGFLFRLGIGALPFLLPLLMQVGFGLSPLRSGLGDVCVGGRRHGHEDAGGAHRPHLRFPHIMIINAVVSSIFLAACALFTVRNAAAADHDPAGGRRLLSLAAVHRHQHAGLCPKSNRRR